MQRSDQWRASFLGALQLLGQAIAHVPFGMPDPILCGASAIELYTGRLWPGAALEVRVADVRVLNAALLAVGFRWQERSRHDRRGLWHPDFQLGVDLVENWASLGGGEMANILTATIAHEFQQAPNDGGVRLQVMGIEDLIVEQVGSWPARTAPAEDSALVTQALVGLGRAGVGGRFRAGYLQRRLLCETGGTVVLDPSTAQSDPCDAEGRTITLTEMRAVIAGWRARCGLSLDPIASAVRTAPCRTPFRATGGLSERGNIEWRSCATDSKTGPVDAAIIEFR